MIANLQCNLPFFTPTGACCPSLSLTTCSAIFNTPPSSPQVKVEVVDTFFGNTDCLYFSPKSRHLYRILQFYISNNFVFYDFAFIPLYLGIHLRKPAFNPGVADFTFIAGCHLPCFTCTWIQLAFCSWWRYCNLNHGLAGSRMVNEFFAIQGLDIVGNEPSVVVVYFLLVAKGLFILVQIAVYNNLFLWKSHQGQAFCSGNLFIPKDYNAEFTLLLVGRWVIKLPSVHTLSAKAVKRGRIINSSRSRWRNHLTTYWPNAP